MARKGNPISVGVWKGLGIRVLLIFSVLIVCYLFSLVLDFDFDLLLLNLNSSFLPHGLRTILRFFGFEIPLFLLVLGSIVGSVGGSSLHMMDPAGGQPAANPAAEQPSNGSSGWTQFDEDVLLEPSGEGGERHHSNSNPSENQPGEQAMPTARPVAAGEAAAGPSHDFPYHEEGVFGGDSVLSIQNRLLKHNPNPSAEALYLARLDAQDRFELKVEVIEGMSTLDPTGDWLNRGARALDNPHTSSGEPSVEELSRMRDDLHANGRHSATFRRLKEKVFLRQDNLDEDAESEA